MGLGRRAVAEFLGTSWLVLGGCGAATLSAKFPFTGIGFLGVAIAFGLTLVSGIYALGAISGGHFNPAVTMGLTTAGRFPAREAPMYVVAQVLGATVGALVLLAIASGAPGFDVASSRLAANGYGAHSPGGYGLAAAIVVELVTTFMFVLIVLGSTDGTAHKPFAPLAIGLGLTLVHLVSIPVTNASVNPARSTGPAIVAGGWALEQVWLFWAAPLVGAVLAGWAYPALAGSARGDAYEATAQGPQEEERLQVDRPAHAR